MTDLDDLAQARLGSLLGGALATQVIAAAAELGVADALAAGPTASAEVATRCGTDPDATARLLGGLVSLGVVEQTGSDCYELADLGELLRTDHDRSLRCFAVVQGRLMAPLWAGLAGCVRTGQSADNVVLGRPFYDHLASRPDLAASFQQAMEETARAWFVEPGLLDELDWSGARLVVDVAGGRGAVLAALLRAHPHLAGIVFDRPYVVAGALELLERAGVAERARVVAGDYLAEVPPGGDVYLLARVLCNLADEAATGLLGRCRQAGAPGARVVLVDSVLPEGEGPHPARLNDLTAMTIGGRSRGPADWTRLLHVAGFGDPVVDERGEGPWGLVWALAR